ncbi:MAG: ZIP family metal transporter [Chitinispirillaceae bacterium]|nr:ZIP family metal transporter [Chitinispirillaceae bacterium]
MHTNPHTFLWVAVFAILSVLVNTAGILAIVRYREWAQKAKIYFMCFAAGVLISTPLMLALPQALTKNSYAGFMAVGGFLFMLFSNRFIRYHTGKKDLAFGIVAAEGIGIHSFVDGIIYAVTFKMSIMTGFLSATGLVVHEFAEGVITYLFFMDSGLKKRTAVFYALLVASLTTPLGAFVAYPLIEKLSASKMGLILGFMAGVLIYVSASHLLPEAIGEQKKHSMLAFLGGVALAVFIVLSKSA